jgi:hypothetical protein
MPWRQFLGVKIDRSGEYLAVSRYANLSALYRAFHGDPETEAVVFQKDQRSDEQLGRGLAI